MSRHPTYQSGRKSHVVGDGSGVKRAATVAGKSSKGGNQQAAASLHRKVTQKNRLEAESAAGSPYPKVGGPSRSSGDVLRKGGIEIESRKVSSSRNALGVPGPRNTMDPREYERQGGDIAAFRSERPAGATGIADLGLMYDDLLSGIGELDGGSSVIF